MRTYLSLVKDQNRAKTLALRFLTTAQKHDESSSEKEIRRMKKNSVFLLHSFEMPKNNNAFLKKSHFIQIKNKIQEDEEKSQSSSNSINSNLTDKKINQNEVFFDAKNSILDEKSIQRPKLKYIPEDMELRALIRRGIVRKK